MNWSLHPSPPVGSPTMMIPSLSWSFVRSLGTKATSERALRRKKVRAEKKKLGRQHVPELKTTLRQLYRLTHPDLFAQYPQEQAANDASYKELLGFLDTIENDPRGCPTAASTLDLPFYLRRPSSEEEQRQSFDQVVLQLHSTGHVSKGRVEESLGEFFRQCGLPPVFEWPAQSWGRSANLAQAQERQATEMAQTKRDRQAEAKAATTTSSSSSTTRMDEENNRTSPDDPHFHPPQQQAASTSGSSSINVLLDDMDPTLQAIAACPMLSSSSDHQEVKDYFEHKDGLEAFHVAGYPGFKDMVHRIWSGERRRDVLLEGLDADTAQLVHRVLLHTLAFERQLVELHQQTTTTSGKDTPPPEKTDTVVQWHTLKVLELRAECKKRGLSTKGLKAALVSRLEASSCDDHDDDHHHRQVHTNNE